MAYVLARVENVSAEGGLSARSWIRRESVVAQCQGPGRSAQRPQVGDVVLLDEGPSGFGFGVLVRSLAERPSWFVGLPDEAERATELGQWSLSQMGQWFVDGRWGAAERGTLHRSGCFKEIVNLSGYRLSDLDLAASDVLVVGENLVVVPGGGRLRENPTQSDRAITPCLHPSCDPPAGRYPPRDLWRPAYVGSRRGDQAREALGLGAAARVTQPEEDQGPMWTDTVWELRLTEVEWRDDAVVVEVEDQRVEVACPQSRATFERFKEALQAESPELRVVARGERSSEGDCTVESVAIPEAMLERFVLLEKRKDQRQRHTVGSFTPLVPFGEAIGLAPGDELMDAYCDSYDWKHREELMLLWRHRDRSRQVWVYRGQSAVIPVRAGDGKTVWVWEESDYGNATFLFPDVDRLEAEAELREVASSLTAVRRNLRAGAYRESLGDAVWVEHTGPDGWWAQVRAVLGL